MCDFLAHFSHISWLAPLKFKCMFNTLFCCFLEGEDRTSTPKRARSILRELDEASGVREGEFRAGKHDLTPSSKMATLPNAKRFEIGKRTLCFMFLLTWHSVCKTVTTPLMYHGDIYICMNIEYFTLMTVHILILKACSKYLHYESGNRQLSL